jgi:hypothetical protein
MATERCPVCEGKTKYAGMPPSTCCNGTGMVCDCDEIPDDNPNKWVGGHHQSCELNEDGPANDDWIHDAYYNQFPKDNK